MPTSANTPSRTKVIEERKLQILLASYTVAVTTSASEAQIQWDRFNTMLVANGILTAFIGLTFSTSNAIPYLIKLSIPLAGLIVCYSWQITFCRGNMWTEFWMKEAQKIEEQRLNELSGLPLTNGKAHLAENPAPINSFSSATYIIQVFAVIYSITITYLLGLLASDFIVYR